MTKIKLFCIPYAGGSAQAYLGWKKWLHPCIELHAIELAGRGRRAGEPLYKSFTEAVDDIFTQISPFIGDNRISFFGHSMGSWLEYELLWKMQQQGIKSPLHVFFSGRYPPYITKNHTQTYKLDDDKFTQFISSVFETVDDLLENRNFIDFILPVIRNDIMLLETYRHTHDILKLRSPVTVMTGKKDSLVAMDDCQKWKACTSGACTIREFDDGHFFIKGCKVELINLINEILVPSVPVHFDAEVKTEHPG